MGENNTDTSSETKVTVSNNGASTTVSVENEEVSMDNVLEDVVNNDDDNAQTNTTDNNEEDTSDNAPEGDNKEDNLQNDLDNHKSTVEDLKADLNSKGMDFDALEKEYNEKGALSDESLDKLNKAGYPKSVVDAYLAGLQAMTERFVNAVYDMAGGKDNYNRLLSYVSTQPKDVLDSFNATIQQGNLGQINLVINGLIAQMGKAYGTANPTVMAGSNASGGTDAYETIEEMTKDMSDPRYQTDPKFTKEVLRKIRNAKFF